MNNFAWVVLSRFCKNVGDDDDIFGLITGFKDVVYNIETPRSYYRTMSRTSVLIAIADMIDDNIYL